MSCKRGARDETNLGIIVLGNDQVDTVQDEVVRGAEAIDLERNGRVCLDTAQQFMGQYHARWLSCHAWQPSEGDTYIDVVFQKVLVVCRSIDGVDAIDGRVPDISGLRISAC